MGERALTREDCSVSTALILVPRILSELELRKLWPSGSPFSVRLPSLHFNGHTLRLCSAGGTQIGMVERPEKTSEMNSHRDSAVMHESAAVPELPPAQYAWPTPPCMRCLPCCHTIPQSGVEASESTAYSTRSRDLKLQRLSEEASG
jgi:hypothetical protein